MNEDTAIEEWLDDFSLWGSSRMEEIRLNEIQKHDTALPKDIPDFSVVLRLPSLINQHSFPVLLILFVLINIYKFSYQSK